MDPSTSELAKTRITDTLYGQRMHVLPNDLIGRKILKHKVYDYFGIEFMRFVLAQIEKPVAVDVGANVGVYTLVMATLADKVITFEPQKNIFSILSANIKLNKLTNVYAFNVGLSSQDALLPFYANLQGNAGASTFVSERKATQFEKEMLTVKKGDDLINQLGVDNIDYIKFDIEGYEIKALIGLATIIQQHRPIITLEWNGEGVRQDFAKQKCFETLFKDYYCMSVCSSYKRYLWQDKAFWRLKREWFKLWHKKHWVLAEFKPFNDYDNVVFIPCEKIDLFKHARCVNAQFTSMLKG